MIEVVVQETGDSAEAATPEDAVYAAMTLCREAHAVMHRRPAFHVSFFVDGMLVRTERETSLGISLIESRRAA